MHSGVAHGYSVADGRKPKNKRDSAAGGYTALGESLKIAHAYVSGHKIGKRGGDTYERFAHIMRTDTCCINKTTIRSSYRALLDLIAAHFSSCLFLADAAVRGALPLIFLSFSDLIDKQFVFKRVHERLPRCVNNIFRNAYRSPDGIFVF